MNNSELQERIDELEERLSKLEKIESRRSQTKTAKIIIKFAIVLAFLGALYYGYHYVDTTYIKPYKETIEKVNNMSESIDSYSDIIDKFKFNN